ncbi:MAG: glyoxalase/bleomycin resistance/dioxygenase family protein [bacterium]|nr:glyoxalase/bleomycin resistance/dioxygenase family protein [Deltaproteobacteria bacterium]MCP4906482.1 glyoxalase/bleomycin resistance/dioxygenase family protein [bacterium]
MNATFSFTKLVVDDLEKMSAYYQQVFGLKPLDRVQADIGIDPIDEIMLGKDSAFGPGSIMLLKFVDKPAPVPGAVILGFQTDDLDALVDRVVESGGSIHVEVKQSDVAPVRVAFVVDPEGNHAECVQFLGEIKGADELGNLSGN